MTGKKMTSYQKRGNSTSKVTGRKQIITGGAFQKIFEQEERASKFYSNYSKYSLIKKSLPKKRTLPSI